jgi:hypothetical protein
MIILSEYDRGYANGQRDILETLKRDVTAMKNSYPPSAAESQTIDAVIRIINKYRK